MIIYIILWCVYFEIVELQTISRRYLWCVGRPDIIHKFIISNMHHIIYVLSVGIISIYIAVDLWMLYYTSSRYTREIVAVVVVYTTWPEWSSFDLQPSYIIYIYVLEAGICIIYTNTYNIWPFLFLLLADDCIYTRYTFSASLSSISYNMILYLIYNDAHVMG